MLMSLGMFVFSISSLPFERKQRSTQWRWAANNRLGQLPAHQFNGPGEDRITLSGTLAPELTGGGQSLQDLRDLADTGKAWVLMLGNGEPQGFWFIDSVDETGSYFFPDGSPRKIEFSVVLVRNDTGEINTIGDLAMNTNSSSFAENIA
ncbi:phage tail protein [Zhongshania borealis]|uniref:Phage tail protein n=1 Tax=Zhongshania borealis TaxID=889488 RepID=A0ABP7WF60_9GAMM